MKLYVKKEEYMNPETEKKFDNFRQGLIPFIMGGLLASMVWIAIVSKDANLNEEMSLLASAGVGLVIFIILLIGSYALQTTCYEEKSYLEMPNERKRR